MTTLTDTITGELLDTMDNPSGLDAVLKRHSRSKGPLYCALAQATTQLQQQLADAAADISRINENRNKLHAETTTLDNRCQEMETKANSLEEKNRQAETKIAEVNELLEQVRDLGSVGFGPNELAHLRDLLVSVAASHGVRPQDAVGLFFEKIGCYEGLMSLELQVNRAQVSAAKAKADEERFMAQAKAAEAKCKARKVSIDGTDYLLAQGVRESDLPRWARIIAKAGVPPEGLAEALERFGSLKKLCLEREGRVKELNSEVKALSEERQQVTAAISAVREKALAAIERTTQETMNNLNALMDKAVEFGELEHQAATLADEIALARAFKNQDAALWGDISRRAVQELLSGLVLWSSTDESRNVEVSVPSSLSSRIHYYARRGVHVHDLLLWALTGTFTDKERKALASR